jgi:hypothetical protein
VFTADRLQRYENIGNAFAVIGAGIGGAARAANAAQPATTYASGTVYNQYGAPVANYGGVARTYDPAAVAVAQSAVNADTAAQVGEIRNEHQTQSAQIGAILRRTTVHPGQLVSGVIELNNTWMDDPIRLHVDFAGEEHSFAFHLAKYNDDPAARHLCNYCRCVAGLGRWRTLGTSARSVWQPWAANGTDVSNSLGRLSGFIAQRADARRSRFS